MSHRRAVAVAVLLVAAGVAAVIYYWTQNQKLLRIGRDTTVAEVRAFPSERQYAAMHTRLDGYTRAVQQAYSAQNWEEYSKQTIALLMYSGALPVVYLDSYAEALMKRADQDSVGPYLSFYIDLGRRLACSSTGRSSRHYGALRERYARSAEPAEMLDAPTVFLRESCAGSGAIRPFSANVGWGLASLMFSDSGETFQVLNAPDVKELLQILQHAVEASDCGSPENPRAFGTSPGGRTTARDVLRATLAAGMDDRAQKAFCRASRDVKGTGIGGLGPTCINAATEMTQAFGLPLAETSFDRMDRFDDYVACMNREFDNRDRGHPFFGDMESRFDGTKPSWARFYRRTDEKDGKTYWERKHRDTREQLEPGGAFSPGHALYEQRVTDSKDYNRVLSRETVDIQDRQGKSGSTLRFTDEHTIDGRETTIETLIVPGDGVYQSTTTCDAQKNCATKYEHDGKAITEKEFEDKKKDEFPQPSIVRPGPDDVLGPCDRILERNQPPVRPQDIDELIQLDPDEAITDTIQKLNSCLADFGKWRTCHTRLMCLDESGEPSCSCKSYSGPPKPTEACPTIQCAADAILVNCMCRNPDGGILPGLGGPLVNFSRGGLPAIEWPTIGGGKP